ncbi:MAG: hypothetical protein GY773_09800 [Actinomycetia bacterium]|nr:hypothetical protein [Actinomycetes bacterium]
MPETAGLDSYEWRRWAEQAVNDGRQTETREIEAVHYFTLILMARGHNGEWLLQYLESIDAIPPEIGSIFTELDRALDA